MDHSALIMKRVVSCQPVTMVAVLYQMLFVVLIMNTAVQMVTTVTDIPVHVMHRPIQFQPFVIVK